MVIFGSKKCLKNGAKFCACLFQLNYVRHILWRLSLNIDSWRLSSTPLSTIVKYIIQNVNSGNISKKYPRFLSSYSMLSVPCKVVNWAHSIHRCSSCPVSSFPRERAHIRLFQSGSSIVGLVLVRIVGCSGGHMPDVNGQHVHVGPLPLDPVADGWTLVLY